MGMDDYVRVENVANYEAFVSGLRAAFGPTREHFDAEVKAYFFAREKDMSVHFGAVDRFGEVLCTTQPGRGRELFDVIGAMNPNYVVHLSNSGGEELAVRLVEGVSTTHGRDRIHFGEVANHHEFAVHIAELLGVTDMKVVEPYCFYGFEYAGRPANIWAHADPWINLTVPHGLGTRAFDALTVDPTLSLELSASRPAPLPELTLEELRQFYTDERLTELYEYGQLVGSQISAYEQENGIQRST